MHGTVKSFDTKNGYGFIISPDHEGDIFFHVRNCFNKPAPNDHVQFEIGQAYGKHEGKKEAIHVRKA